MFWLSGEHQHPRQRVPAAGVHQGAAPLHPAELRPAGGGVRVGAAAASVEQPAGLLQVSVQPETCSSPQYCL